MAPHLISTSSSLSVVQGEEPQTTRTNTESVIKRTTNHQNEAVKELAKTETEYKWNIAWRNVIAFLILHPASFLAFYWMIQGHSKFSTFVFCKYFLF